VQDGVRGILGQHFMFSYLPPSNIEHLSQLATTRTYEAGQPIFLKGDPGNALMAVIKGRVRICSYSADEGEVVLNVMRPGEVFGEIALIDGGERTASAFALELTELLVLSRHDFLTFLNRDPDACLKLLQLMCQRLRWTTEHLEDVNFLDLRCRLAKRLLYLTAHHGEQSGNEKRGVRISQQLLANMIGTSREAVNKQLGAWKEERVIATRRGRVTVLDRVRLGRIVEESA
jgi:CRP/FNR family transcriptional regulator, cyclic AMP receptor protein